MPPPILPAEFPVIVVLTSCITPPLPATPPPTDGLRSVQTAAMRGDVADGILDIGIRASVARAIVSAVEVRSIPVLSTTTTSVGFGIVEGIVALAITSHPDFDDTPLFDENADRDYKNDGVVWHPHWVVLRGDDRVAGGLSVRQFEPGDESVTLPPTNPGMPMYMDSPGFGVVWNGGTLRVIVPEYRVSNKLAFKFDALAA